MSLTTFAGIYRLIKNNLLAVFRMVQVAAFADDRGRGLSVGPEDRLQEISEGTSSLQVVAEQVR